MPDTIRDGTGAGFQAQVGSDNRLNVRAISESVQHAISHENEDAYQVFCTTSLAAATVVCIHLRNDSAIKNVIFTYIRHQTVGASGGASFPDSGNYFSIAFGRTRSSGGSLLTPVNVFSGSGNTADLTVYGSNPTLTGTATEVDRWYTRADGDVNLFEKEGSLIIAPNNTVELRYIGDQTSGIIYTRLSFVIEITTQ